MPFLNSKLFVQPLEKWSGAPSIAGVRSERPTPRTNQITEPSFAMDRDKRMHKLLDSSRNP
jgi:hypothetical protein